MELPPSCVVSTANMIKTDLVRCLKKGSDKYNCTAKIVQRHIDDNTPENNYLEVEYITGKYIGLRSILREGEYALIADRNWRWIPKCGDQVILKSHYRGGGSFGSILSMIEHDIYEVKFSEGPMAGEIGNFRKTQLIRHVEEQTPIDENARWDGIEL
jgi:hypothetical protein